VIDHRLEEKVDLLIPIHNPQFFEFLFNWVSTPRFLLLLDNFYLILSIKAVVLLIFILLLPIFKFVASLEELAPELEHLVGVEYLACQIELFFLLQFRICICLIVCTVDLWSLFGFLLLRLKRIYFALFFLQFFDGTILVEKRSYTSGVVSFHDVDVAIHLNFDQKEFFAAHTFDVHFTCVFSQFFVDISPMKALVKSSN